MGGTREQALAIALLLLDEAAELQAVERCGVGVGVGAEGVLESGQGEVRSVTLITHPHNN